MDRRKMTDGIRTFLDGLDQRFEGDDQEKTPVRVASAWIHIPYPWVLGEAHKVKAVTKTGTVFEHEIAS